MGLGIGEEPVWCPLTMEHSVSEKNRFTEEKKTSTKNNTMEDGRLWWRTKVGKRWVVSAEGRAWVPVSWEWKGHL